MSLSSGIFFHGIGAASASLCYTPQKKTRQWSWQTYWLAQALVCWLILPILVAWLTIPELSTVLAKAPVDAMWKTFVLGALYGIGGTAFGLSIRYLGFSLTYGIAVGISCVLGTLLPPLVHGELQAHLSKPGSGWVIAGVFIGVLGIILCGVAGRSKEVDRDAGDNLGSFSLSKGIPLCLLAGVLSAVYGFSLDQGQPIADIAAQHGAGRLQGNVVYIFSNSGAFLSTLIYCIFLHRKQGTIREYMSFFDGPGRSVLAVNYFMAALTGIMWYCQFFFYGIGHTGMGSYKFSSWAIHMIMLVLFSTIAGVAMKEWAGCKQRTVRMLVFAILILLAAILSLTWGNYLAAA